MSNYLTVSQVEELVSVNRYVYKGEKFQSRCFSGNYQNSERLPPLALPGGDIGDLAVLISASESYGFDCSIQGSIEVMKKLVGAISITTFQHLPEHTAEQCRYLHFLSENPEIFSLNNEKLTEFIQNLKKQGLIDTLDQYRAPKQKESALIIYEGLEGLYPQFEFDSFTTKFNAQVLIFHRTLVDERRKMFVSYLLKEKVVTLYNNLDEDYLYEILSDVGDTHLFETVLKIDPHLPVYNVAVSENGKVKVDKAS